MSIKMVEISGIEINGKKFAVIKKEKKCYIRIKELVEYFGFIKKTEKFIESLASKIEDYNEEASSGENIEIKLDNKIYEKLINKYQSFCKGGKIDFGGIDNKYSAVSDEFLNIIINDNNNEIFNEEIKEIIKKLRVKINNNNIGTILVERNIRQNKKTNKETQDTTDNKRKQDNIFNKQKQVNKISNKERTIEEIIKLYKINGIVSSEICKMSFSYKDFEKNDNNEYTRNALSYKGIYEIIIKTFEEDYFGVCIPKEYKYIGSASGGNGIVGRWDEHISKGGDAKKLKNKLEDILYSSIKKEITFMPLMFVKSNISKSEINRLENYYKKEYNTRYSKDNPTGLNQN